LSFDGEGYSLVFRKITKKLPFAQLNIALWNIFMRKMMCASMWCGFLSRMLTVV